jgi:hypothetical protein
VESKGRDDGHVEWSAGVRRGRAEDLTDGYDDVHAGSYQRSRHHDGYGHADRDRFVASAAAGRDADGNVEGDPRHD